MFRVVRQDGNRGIPTLISDLLGEKTGVDTSDDQDALLL